MNLKSLELFGFKSFMRKLDIRFSDGITIIVGPNGCGKTNVTDALRWVLGEGNARALRGNRMEDLIFNGTRDYKPLNVAEVSLSIDNSSGVLPTEYTEVTVTRRVYRNGEPEFLINKVPGRLRDIHDLFMDTGLGSRAYSVIERDMVEGVLADQPEKRRELLEEAAGIMKYKRRERQARRKLEATDDDLHRIDDVLREVERQVRSLKRQVGAARRFQELRDRQRDLEVSLAVVELHEVLSTLRELEQGLTENRTERDGAAGKVAALDAEIESRRLRMAEADGKLSEIQRQVDEMNQAAQKLEGDNRVRRERRESALANTRRLAAENDELQRRIQDAVSRVTELETDRAAREEIARTTEEKLAEAERSLANMDSDLATRRRELASARESAEGAAQEVARRRTELANLDAHREHLEDRESVLAEEMREIEASMSGHAGDLRATEERLASTRGEIDRLTNEIQAKEKYREELDREREEARREESRLAVEAESARSTLEMLRGLQERREGFGGGARALLGRGESRWSSLADAVHVTRQDLLPALDGALDVAVEWVVAPSQADAVAGVRALSPGDGPATIADRAAFQARAAQLPPVPQDGAVLGRAADFVQAPSEQAPVLDWLLSRVVLVETLDDAMRLAGRPDGEGLRFVSRDGDWAEFPGVVHRGKRGGADASILGRADRIAALETKLGETELALESVRTKEEQLSVAREEASASLDELRRTREGVRERLGEEDRAVERSRAAQAAAEKRLEIVGEERRALASRREEVVRERDARASGVDEADAKRADLDDNCRRREEELVASNDDRDQMQRAVQDLRVEQERARGEAERVELELSRLTESRRADEEGVSRRSEETSSLDQLVGELAREIEEGLETFATKTNELEAQRQIRDEVASDRQQIIADLREVEEERTRWTKLRDSAGELLHEQEMSQQREMTHREEIVERIEREFSVNLALPDAAEAHGRLLEADEEVREENRRELEELRRQLERLGAVNMVALDQYDREAKRYEFLKTQKEDLEEAREKLRRTIRKINRKARTMFMETLEEVRKHFAETFSTLFPGGQADIRLVGDEDPLHAPIEIFARPRGKRLANISLMSSGERSLTAVAFLFAIYLVKPSPFCILDEVDAPLDDANIGRFLDMLRKVAKNTQLVMITHNKKTMEVADYLYGVTMESPGVSKLVSVELGTAQDLVEEDDTTPQAAPVAVGGAS